jgi:hypothetical protein
MICYITIENSNITYYYVPKLLLLFNFLFIFDHSSYSKF